MNITGESDGSSYFHISVWHADIRLPVHRILIKRNKKDRKKSTVFYRDVLERPVVCDYCVEHCNSSFGRLNGAIFLKIETLAACNFGGTANMTALF
ncbi:hypothetical protein WJ0W_003863 [Paenibacillus melissococcoides]|uniref:Uncharacterized protein n=1 Tax=Paenibacillus melissococcoides TaxID=2912268 RepID=A0ABM9G4C2_9BACL|nr:MULTISPECIES: hypothetical protein [Paenibacillus]MEB9894518.1 hypothetical protein [Bacillus cereus]CAH8246629.1 hypothetical protein WJ0W_003863 [Paenibacillus melissococcoides]CAH8716241.1 hypothetical protein WDD9_004499 [Paenibacillus melissococcoides]